MFFWITAAVVIIFTVGETSIFSTLSLSGGLSLLFLISHLILSLMQRRGISRLTGELSQIDQEKQIDLTHEIPDQGRGSEVQIADHFNRFTDRVNSIFINISRSTRKFNLFASDIFFSARNLSQQSHEQSQGMEEILNQVSLFQGSLSSLEEEISKILEKLTGTSKANRELGEKSNRVSHNLVELASDTHRASQEASEGLTSINESAKTITLLVEIMDHLRESMTVMNERTKLVGEVIVKLDDIAERTHVLATNASIEAARAGKQGKSFGVIAAEVRTLAGHSQEAIAQVNDFLKEMSRSINDNSRSWKIGVDKVNDVHRFGDEAKSVLANISAHMGETSQSMSDFQKQFEEQDTIVAQVQKDSSEIESRIKSFDQTLHEQAEGYSFIKERIDNASLGAESASKSAAILSQLATYLKVGGKELQYSVKQFMTSDHRHLQGFSKRQEKRRSLLYNLEVFMNERFIGNLGDLSSAGLLLYSDEELTVNSEYNIDIVLPIGFSYLEKITVAITPRRSKVDGATFRIGCSLHLVDSSQQRAFIEMIEKLTIHEESQAPHLNTLPAQIPELETHSEQDELEELDELEEV